MIKRNTGGLLDRTVIVLCRPEESGNVGAVCRAMKTMGIKQLRIVKGRELNDHIISYRSVHAFDVYENAAFYDTLPEALADIVLSAGTTRRRGKKRKTVSLLPEEFAERASATTAGRIGVIFGNERTGLTDAELAECAIAVHIPSSSEFASLNLSHAVQILSYEMYRAAVPAAGYTPVARERIESLTTSAIASLEEIGFFSTAGNSITTEFLRDVFSRAHLSKTEADRMEKMFRKIANLKIHLGR
jgi:tRNA/rRNA methyltransferase